ncbi:T-complex protein 11-like protein 1 isoform X1 [Osmerus eperlanus]|uniref:T-complex protein 11-like protein 1 isoform X1 n=2 Tax=Osmerus eperlanus TaxID=29151 RepID=UPI002E15E7B4
MPKDSDKPGCGKDNNTEDRTEISEDSLMEKTSPTRFVSVEELMRTAKGVTNMALAHEIVVNQGFQVKPVEPPEGSLEKKIKEVMHKAFWDCLEGQLREEPPSYHHAIKLLAEIKETLLSFLLTGPGHTRLRALIQEVLDLELIQQQAENSALDIRKVVEFVVGMMGSLCAPSRDGDIRALKEITDLVPLLRAIFLVLDKMKIDMANFAVSSIRPHLLQQSVEYERNKFQEFLDKQPNALDLTEKWLEDAVRSLQESGADGSGMAASNPLPLLPVNVHNHAFLYLLKWDHASEPFPETVLMDQVRFQEMKRDVGRLALVATVLLVVYNTSGEAIAGLPGLMDTLKNTIYTLLTDLHQPSFRAADALATIAERLCVDLGEVLSQHGFTPFSSDRQRVLKGQISAVAHSDNAVRKVIDSRIQTYLLGVLESSVHKSAPSLPGGLAPISKELEELAVKFGRLVNLNKLVFSPFYQQIFQKILKDDATA